MATLCGVQKDQDGERNIAEMLLQGYRRNATAESMKATQRVRRSGH